LGEQKLNLKSTSNNTASDLLNVLEDDRSRLREGSRANTILNGREDVATGEFNL